MYISIVFFLSFGESYVDTLIAVLLGLSSFLTEFGTIFFLMVMTGFVEEILFSLS